MVIKKVDRIHYYIMKEIIIKAPQGAKYLSDFTDTLPDGILNKVDTGCGATTVALTNSENTIICCPSKSMIINKTAQYPNERLNCPYSILGVMEGIYSRDITRFIEACKERQHPVKIMVTYDSFHKIKNTVEHIDDYRVVVDEYQELLKIYSYRDKAVRKLLKDIKDLSKVTFLSATPIPYRYTPKELEKFSMYKIDWGQTVRCKPIRKKTNKPYLAAKNLILEHKTGSGFNLDGVYPKELFFFVNSVTGIKNIIDGAGLTNEEVRVICADNQDNKSTLDTIDISTTTSANKPYTFCTSTVFYGADFYSDSGLVIIVSDGRNQNTRLDIATDIIQIAGRIRNPENPFKHIIFHIYNTGWKIRTREKLDIYLKERTKSANSLIQQFTKADSYGKKALAERIKMKDQHEFAMYDEDSNTVSLNEMKINYLIYKFESVDEVYKNGVTIREAYANAGMDVSVSQQWEFIAAECLQNVTRCTRFKELYIEYLEELKKSVAGQRTPRAKKIESIYPTINRITQLITPEEVQSRNYNITMVNDLLYHRLPETQDAIKEQLKPIYKSGRFYSNKFIKSQFVELYNRLFIKITPKATDIAQYYHVEPAKETVDGKRENGYRIIDKLFLAYAPKSGSQTYLYKLMSVFKYLFRGNYSNHKTISLKNI